MPAFGSRLSTESSRSSARRRLAVIVVVGTLAACSGGDTGSAGPVSEGTEEAHLGEAPEPPVEGPRLRILGTAQDGGLPHAACSCVRCNAARNDPQRARSVASLALVLPAPGDEEPEIFLVDATPDLRRQLHALEDLRAGPGDRVDRRPVDGVLLTHAHIGHYLGLAFFGFEAVSTRDLPVWATPRMAGFLRGHGPWSQLVTKGNITLREVPPGEAFFLGRGEELTVTPLAVPHRDEFSDTVAFRIEGPRATALYVPDTDTWETWSPSLESALEGVDVALLDATFYSMDELPGRDITQVRHPLMTATMDRLQSRVDAGALRVLFTHLNHTNPSLDPESPAAAEIHRRGFAVARDGQEIPL